MTARADDDMMRGESLRAMMRCASGRDGLRRRTIAIRQRRCDDAVSAASQPLRATYAEMPLLQRRADDVDAMLQRYGAAKRGAYMGEREHVCARERSARDMARRGA